MATVGVGCPGIKGGCPGKIRKCPRIEKSVHVLKFLINRTFAFHDEMMTFLKNLNFYFFNHKSKLSEITKTINTLQTNFLIVRNSTKNLLKTNMNKKTRKFKKIKSFVFVFD